MSRAPLQALLAAVLAAASTLSWAADRRAPDGPDAVSAPVPLVSVPDLGLGREAAAARLETAAAAPQAAAPLAAPAPPDFEAAKTPLPAPQPEILTRAGSAEKDGGASVDDQGLRLFDGGGAKSASIDATPSAPWRSRVLLALGPRRRVSPSPSGLPVFDEVTARQLRSLSPLSAQEVDGLARWLERAKIPVTGALPYSADTTFSLELELLANRQMSEADLRPLFVEEYALSDEQWKRWRGHRELPRWAWERAHDFALERLRAALPAGWRVTTEGESAYSNTLEIHTSNSGGVFHRNTARDWEDLVAGLEKVRKAVPAGLYSAHLHIGRISLPKKKSFRSGGHESLLIDDARFAAVAVMFEGLWRPLLGHGLQAEPHASVLPSYDAILRAIHSDDPSVKFGVSSHDHWVNVSLYQPTVENRSITQLLSKTPGGAAQLDPKTLRQDLWPAFALFDMLYRAQELPFATLGLPVAAGTVTTRKQLLHFLDLAYGDDVAGKALALRRLADALQVRPSGTFASGASMRRDQLLRERYVRGGLGVVYKLHEAHDGWDEKLSEHLLADPRALDELASDLVRAQVTEREAARLFPPEMAAPLEQAMKRHANAQAATP